MELHSLSFYPFCLPITLRKSACLTRCLRSRIVVTDNQYQYKNLFDAMTDAHYAALEKAGAPNLEIVISESGWPSEETSSHWKSRNLLQEFVGHVNGNTGTPRKPGKAIETYLFALFDEHRNLQDWSTFCVFSPVKRRASTNFCLKELLQVSDGL
ncbi:glucan endo-1,3-beta-glucosidase, acidic-like [Pistacia vera]|uniref:glucan endo-1,3-beta-glucosidase, acidic-like n=1 Tax=Pistacia vera TaxID=55513 RepID=UPI0012636623|nr:glucan endo-1,3-beta-glucosidase, acidic-like [Pistacia vera]